MLQGRNVARESSLRTAVCAAMWGTCCHTTGVLGHSAKLQQQQLVPARLGLTAACEGHLLRAGYAAHM